MRGDVDLFCVHPSDEEYGLLILFDKHKPEHVADFDELVRMLIEKDIVYNSFNIEMKS